MQIIHEKNPFPVTPITCTVYQPDIGNNNNLSKLY